MVKKRKLKLSKTERDRRRKQALKNFKSRSKKSNYKRIKTRRSNKMVKRKVRRSSRSKYPIKPLAMRGLGSGLSGTLGGVVNNFAPQVAGNVASALGGGALMYFGKGSIKQIGEGALIKSIGDFVEENLAPRLSGLFGGSTGSQQSTSNMEVI